MQKSQLIMGMPITVTIVDQGVTGSDYKAVFDFLKSIDEQFSPYKKTSEVSRINRKELSLEDCSQEMNEIIALAEHTTQVSSGYFDLYHNGYFDPTGIVKGWAIQKAAQVLEKKGFQNFAINAGGDIHVSGKNEKSQPWKIGIRNPFSLQQQVKVIRVEHGGVATSGTYIRGEHISTPRRFQKSGNAIVSLTVIGPTICDADRFATAAFAMGENGIAFIDALEGYEGYMIDVNGTATMTRGFQHYVC